MKGLHFAARLCEGHKDKLNYTEREKNLKSLLKGLNPTIKITLDIRETMTRKQQIK
jgi:hypothetical protein